MVPPDLDAEHRGAQAEIPAVDEPTWSRMHHLAETSSLSTEGKKAVGHVLDRLEARLGRSWPRRLYARHGHLFPELVLFSSHVAALPRLLTFAVQLEAVAEDPSFAPVLRTLKQEPISTDWQHMKLQLEVARAARAVGWGAEFEPSIPGSPRKGDLLLTLSEAGRVLVEVGYTSLSQLKNLPVSELKIDRSFVTTMAEDPSNALIVQSVVDLGHNLGLTLVAEGVETEQSLTALAGFGCDVAQGYYLSRPITAAAFDTWCAVHRAAATPPAPEIPGQAALAPIVP